MRVEQSALLESEYFPCMAWYREFMRHEQVVIEQFEYFERATLRNRCYVAGPHGRLCLSVPLEGGRNQKQLMKDIRISNREAWQVQHWRTLEACYRRSPYFGYFEAELQHFFTRPFRFLLDLNSESLRLINDCLKVKHTFDYSGAWQDVPGAGCLDLRARFTAKEYMPDPPVVYTQPFAERQGFVGGLSMLDLLCCAGKHGLEALRDTEK